MQKEAIYHLLNEKVVFQGIAVRDFKEGIFCGLFDIKGTPFILDGIGYSHLEEQVWDVSDAKLFHYTAPSEDETVHVCPFCSYEYETGKPLHETLLCTELNAEPYLGAIWGSCVFSESFNATFEQLKLQLNPKGIKAT